MNLNLFMQNGITDILKTAGRFYMRSKMGRAFLAHILPQIKKSASIREKAETSGIHIPPFLIASIASQCNLHCAGCYARAGGACHENESKMDLSKGEWANIFEEAAALGVSFILLAGGEPLIRRDVIAAAAEFPNLIFPIFTNGTLIDADYLSLFNQNRNLIPVLSMEGTENDTDARRGSGIHAKIETAMSKHKKQKILFGVSVTVTSENMNTVLTKAFLSDLRNSGCGVVFFVEYVPIEKGTENLALNEMDIEKLKQNTDALKTHFDDMVILSFPGDEEAMGGCLASGRGFFHINPSGGAEPCPFSPYAKYNLRDSSIRQVLSSSYFNELRTIAACADPHTGGCVLFEREKEVQALLAQ